MMGIEYYDAKEKNTQQIVIRQATMKDVSYIEEVLLDAVHRLRDKKIPNLWDETNTLWSNLSKQYDISQFYVGFHNEEVVGIMALTDQDLTYWPDIPKGKSIYLHKLAVKQNYSRRGVAKSFIEYAKNYAKDRGCDTIRLDCNKNQPKLRSVYEKQGFKCVKELIIKNDYGMALYSCKVV